MRRQSKPAAPKRSADSQRLVMLSNAVAMSSSRLEERSWEHTLDALAIKLLKQSQQEVIDSAMEELSKCFNGAYEVLIDTMEAASETCTIEHEGKTYDAILMAVPILAWTRYVIASGSVAQDLINTAATHLRAHILASDAKLSVTPMLYSIDQLPRSHVEIHAMTQKLAHACLTGQAPRAASKPPETAPFLADTRYLLTVVVVPQGAPLMRWQETQNLADKDAALDQWRHQAAASIARMLPGCGVELLMPAPYFSACREADKKIRPASISAAVNFLTHTLNIVPGELSAAVAACMAEDDSGRIDEYRIGLTMMGTEEVVYGVVWPLYGDEDENAREPESEEVSETGLTVPGKTPIEEIEASLRQSGVEKIVIHREYFAMEACDDCGAPFFPDMEGELVHAEMPEDMPQPPSHLH